MTLPKPYPHMFRNRNDGSQSAFSEMYNSDIAKSSRGAYRLLVSDLNQLFEYIEPVENNFSAYSHRTYELLLRACTEVESNLKIIFSKNNITPATDNILGYSDLEGPMRLSEFEISFMRSQLPSFRPFDSFLHPERKFRSPQWYKGYNTVKHNRAEKFADASFENVIKAIGAVYALLDAQFGFGHHFDDMERPFLSKENEVFVLKNFPKFIPPSDYDNFDWNALKASGSPFSFCPVPVRP